MHRIGLTGGIGSGKTTVAGLLAEHGAVIIDADAIARDVVEPGMPALSLLALEFGDDIVRSDGSLDRGALAARAFRDTDGTQRLNAIMHPLIREESQRRLAEAPDTCIVVYDMPLLFETGQQDLVDEVVVVDVPEDLQVERAVGLRGLEEVDVRRRMQAQWSRSERLSGADHVIDNSGDLEATKRQVDELWTILSGDPG